jgi:hypothetical protein
MATPTRNLRHLALSGLLLAVAGIAATHRQEPRVLVFSKTTGYRHTSIESGIAAVQKLGRENGFAVEATEDAAAFTERNRPIPRPSLSIGSRTRSSCVLAHGAFEA